MNLEVSENRKDTETYELPETDVEQSPEVEESDENFDDCSISESEEIETDDEIEIEFEDCRQNEEKLEDTSNEVEDDETE